jgi:hypothetical protein
MSFSYTLRDSLWEIEPCTPKQRYVDDDRFLLSGFLFVRPWPINEVFLRWNVWVCAEYRTILVWIRWPRFIWLNCSVIWNDRRLWQVVTSMGRLIYIALKWRVYGSPWVLLIEAEFLVQRWQITEVTEHRRGGNLSLMDIINNWNEMLLQRMSTNVSYGNAFKTYTLHEGQERMRCVG